MRPSQDLEHPLNSRPEGAYSPLESALGCLEALTDVPARGVARYPEVYGARDSYGRCARGQA